MTVLSWCLFSLLVAPSAGILIGDITKCQTGATSLIGGDAKVFTVQVCNFFGNTCYMNQVELPSDDCATAALKIEHKTCALFPIVSFADYDRTTAAKRQVGGLGCYVSCSGTDCKFNGACVSVQCSKGTGNGFAGPAKTNTGSTSTNRVTGVTDTSTATFETHTFAAIGTNVGNLKTVFLSRTGDHVGTYKRGGSSSGTNTYNYGLLPTMSGNNYGPIACPSSTTLASATTLTKEELRMCGSTGEWVYFAAINLLMDKSMGAKYSGNSATGVSTGAKVNIGNVPYLHGDSNYQSGAAMNDKRKVYLWATTTVTGDPLLTSQTIEPEKSDNMKTPASGIAGAWRTYAVVFYCSDYTRTDLTTCASDKRKMFYIGDPNPSSVYGAAAGDIGGGDSSDNNNKKASGSVGQASVGVASLMAVILGMMC